MDAKYLKSVTVHGTTNGKVFRLKIGDKIMHGHYGVLELVKAWQYGNKSCTKVVVMKTLTGEQWAFGVDLHDGFKTKGTFLFKIS